MRISLTNWHRVEKKIGKKLVELDEPSKGAHSPNVGTAHNFGNDEVSLRLSVEVKTSEKKTFSLKSEILQKAAKRASEEGKIPAIYIETCEFGAWVFPTEVAEMFIEDHKVVERLIEKDHNLFMELRSNG